MRHLLTWSFAAVAACHAAAAFAHFPFLHVKTEGGTPTLHVYFAETAAPDDPALLDRLAGAEVWRVAADGTAEPLSVKKGAGSLETPAEVSGPAAFAFHKDYGVLTRGDETFGLIYHAKTFTGPEAWEIKPGERSRLDIVPHREGNRLTVTVLWEGKPLPNSDVVLQGGNDYEEAKTDSEGRFACDVTSDEVYSIRARHVVAEPGEHDGKKFGAARHYATLTLDFGKR